MCGIFGIYLKNENYKAGNYILNGLKVLQHRGQDSAGICTLKNNKFFFQKNNGNVSEVFNDNHIDNLLEGNIGLGHVRYSTLSSLNVDLCQPFYTTTIYNFIWIDSFSIDKYLTRLFGRFNMTDYVL